MVDIISPLLINPDRNLQIVEFIFPLSCTPLPTSLVLSWTADGPTRSGFPNEAQESILFVFCHSIHPIDHVAS